MIRAALVALALLGCAAALAQSPQPPKGKRRGLEELRGDWDEKFKAHAQVRAAADAVEARLKQKQQEHTAQQGVVAAAEKEAAEAWLPWPANSRLQSARAKLRAIAEELARETLNLDQLRTREKALRSELTREVGPPLVERLLELADPELDPDPSDPRRAEEMRGEALEVLRDCQNLAAAEGPPDPVPQFPDLEGEVAGKSAAELEQHVEKSYAPNLRECEAILVDLLADEKEMTTRLRRLDRRVQDKAGGERTIELRDRQRKALERVIELRQAFETRANRYRERVQALQAAAEQALRRQAEEQERRSTGRDGPGAGGG